MSSKKSQLIKELAQFHRSHPAIAVIVWLTTIVFGIIFAQPARLEGLFLLPVYIGFIGAVAISILKQYEDTLLRRMSNVDSGPEWTVEVNGVPVGSISDAAYAKIRHDVFFDVRTYISQLMNFGRLAGRVLDSFFVAIPPLAFWVVVACYFFVPTAFAEWLGVLQKITPAEANAAIPQIAKLFGMLTFLAVVISVVLGRRFGFVNRFSEGTNERLRRLVECPAEGDITLFRLIDGNRFPLSEREAMRRPVAKS